jgi:RimJ/RimL family protein N-acetyltransferase
MHEPAIRVVPMIEDWRPALLALSVAPDQREHIGDMADILADVAMCTGSEAMVILCGDVPVGFCRLDPHARSVASRDLEAPALGLRTFFIDAHWQGRSIGTAALQVLLEYVGDKYPAARLIALSVSADNAIASRLYRRAGFEDHGQLYHGGRSGPQRLMLRTLP